MEQPTMLPDHPPPQYHEAVSTPDEKPALDEKPRHSGDDAASNSTYEGDHFNSTGSNKSFFIDALGQRCGFKSTPLETNITSKDDTQSYISVRRSRASGDCTLSHTKRGTVLSTEYKFGPGRPPKVHYHSPYPSSAASSEANVEPITIHGKTWSRTTEFIAPDGRTFEWHYARDKPTKSNLIVLKEKGTGATEPGKDSSLAMLVRNKETRPAKTSKWTAGNGGELVIASDAAGVIDEALVIATCLVMLKKEVDRQNSAIIAGAAASA